MVGPDSTIDLVGSLIGLNKIPEWQADIPFLKLLQIQYLVGEGSEHFLNLEAVQSLPLIGVAHGGYYIFHESGVLFVALVLDVELEVVPVGYFFVEQFLVEGHVADVVQLFCVEEEASLEDGEAY